MARISCALEEFAHNQWGARCHVIYKLSTAGAHDHSWHGMCWYGSTVRSCGLYQYSREHGKDLRRWVAQHSMTSYSRLSSKERCLCLFRRCNQFTPLIKLASLCNGIYCLVKSSGSMQQHSEHVPLSRSVANLSEWQCAQFNCKRIKWNSIMWLYCIPDTHENRARVSRTFLPHAGDAIHPALWKWKELGTGLGSCIIIYEPMSM